MFLISRVFLAGATALSVFVFASGALAAADMATALKQTQSQIWQIRAEGFHALEDADDTAHPVLTDQKVRGTLIALLQRETGFHDHRQRFSGYMDYYSDLLAQVAAWKDSRAMPILMDSRVITTGNIATRGVAAFGDTAVAPAIARYQASGNILERVSMLSVLDHIAENRAPLSVANAQNMRTTLLTAARDSDPLIRVGAVRGLAMFRDNFARETLKTIAGHDPFKSGVGNFYPVRNEAARALAAMDGKGPRTSAD